MYTEEKIRQMCKDQLNKDASRLYAQGFINSRGRTSDTNEYYSEIIAKCILDNINRLESIRSICRLDKSYKTDSHTGEYEKRTNREEEYIAKDMFNECKKTEYEFIGKVIDYQTPLNNKKKDGYGKIDLLSYKDDSLYILELKRPKSKSPETMLRCVLEGYPYSKIVDRKKLLDNFGLSSIVNEKNVFSAPLVAFNESQWQELHDEKNKRPNLRELMTKLNVTPFYYKEKSPTHYEVLKD